jgi:hypothetical protein
MSDYFGSTDPRLDKFLGDIQNAKRGINEAMSATAVTGNLEAEDGNLAVYVNGEPVPFALTGTANEIQVVTSTDTITFQFPTGFIFKNKNTPTDARDAIEAAHRATPAITGAVIPLAKITGGGADGSLTVNAEGIVTAYTAPT